MISRYIRSFQKTDPRPAIQYACCVALGASSTPTASEYEKAVSQTQLDLARELVRKTIVGTEGQWQEIIGSVKDDGTIAVCTCWSF